MKNFLNWLKNSTKIKRWIFLILVGIVLTCYGFTKILTTERLELIDLVQVIITFVVGFICFVLGIIYIQRRNFELLIEANKVKVDENGKSSDLKNLISKQDINKKGPNIVVIGGREWYK